MIWIEEDQIISAKVCLDFGFYGVAFHTEEFCVLAAVGAEGVAGEDGACEEEEADAP